MTTLKTCTACKKAKDSMHAFSACAAALDGRQARCKVCASEFYFANKAHSAAKSRARYLKTKWQIKAREPAVTERSKKS